MNTNGRILSVALALCAVCVIIAVPSAVDADDAGVPIDAGFDWSGIAADTDYQISEEVVIGSDVKDLVIPETTTITIADGGSLTFEDCTATLAGDITVLSGGVLVISSFELTLDGEIVAMAGSTVHLKIDSYGGQEYDFVAPDASDGTIFTLATGSISISETLNGYEEETYKFTVDGTAVFDMIELGGGVVSYEVVVAGGGDLTIADDLAEEGKILNSGKVTIDTGVTVSHEGYDFVNEGEIVVLGTLDMVYDTLDNNGVVRNSGTVNVGDRSGVDNSGEFINDGAVTVEEGTTFVNNGVLSGTGMFSGAVSGEGTIEGGIFDTDVTVMLADGLALYDYEGVKIVSVADASEAAIVIGGIPFATVADALGIINAGSDGYMTAVDSILKLIDDMPVTADVDITIPAGSEVTIDLNGYDMSLGDVTLNGRLALIDDATEPGVLTVGKIDVFGGTLTGNVTVMAASGDAIVYVYDAGVVSGLAFNITTLISGAITVQPGITGDVSIRNITVSIIGTESTVDHGIFVNPTAEDGSVLIYGVTFDFDGNDSCPVVIVPDEHSHIVVSDLTYTDCARTNKVLIDAQTTPVTVGSDGNIDFNGISDVVLWDSSEEGDNVFTVAGDIVVDGRIAVTAGGQLIVPDYASMVVNDRIEISSDASVAGKLTFGSDRSNSIDLTDVVAGEDGLTLSLGSVVISGSVVSGTMELSGSALIEGDVDLGDATLRVPAGSMLMVPAGSSVSGVAPIEVEGSMAVFGSVASPVSNSGTVDVYEGGEVTGNVTGNEPVDVDEIIVSIKDIADVSIELGKTLRVAVSVLPMDARITAAIGEDALDVQGRTIAWTPEEAGTFTVTVTAEYEGQVDTATFDVTVTEPADDGDGWDIDWRYVIIAIVLIVMVILLVVRFL